MSIMTNPHWLIVHKDGRTKVYWQGHDVTAHVTAVDWSTAVNEPTVGKITVLANVEVELTIQDEADRIQMQRHLAEYPVLEPGDSVVHSAGPNK